MVNKNSVCLVKYSRFTQLAKITEKCVSQKYVYKTRSPKFKCHREYGIIRYIDFKGIFSSPMLEKYIYLSEK